MNSELRANKQILRSFMRNSYTDDRLVMLLDHARSEQLVYVSCCCFIGVATADHELQSINVNPGFEPHYNAAQLLPNAVTAEKAYWKLNSYGDDSHRRRILIPMILAELKRRNVLTEVSDCITEGKTV